MSSTCPSCANEYDRLSQHFAMSECSFPELSNHQHEVAIGLLMGDGCLSGRSFENPYIECQMVTPEYLNHLHETFGVLSTGPPHSARDATENWQELYRWQSRTCPDFSDFESWYSSGEKVWPDDISLTPTILKHWYCGDGSWNNKNGQNHVSFAITNEVSNSDKIKSYFSDTGLPEPKISGKEAIFTVSESKDLLAYMGNPLPGFDYKWPDEYQGVNNED